MKTFPILLCAFTLVLALAPTAAMAQSPDPDESQREALASRYFAAAHLDAQIRRLINMAEPMVVDQMLKQKPNMTDAERAKILDIVSQSMLDGLADIQPDYDKGVIRVIASTFTADELRALVNFYEGPTGQSILSKQSEMAGPMSQVMMGLMPRFQADIRRHACANLGLKCGGRAAASRDPS